MDEFTSMKADLEKLKASDQRKTVEIARLKMVLESSTGDSILDTKNNQVFLEREAPKVRPIETPRRESLKTWSDTLPSENVLLEAIALSNAFQ